MIKPDSQLSYLALVPFLALCIAQQTHAQVSRGPGRDADVSGSTVAGTPDLWGDAHEVLIPGLEELAEWCRKHRLYLERSRIYNMVLQLQPDNRAARKGLRYFKSGKRWLQSASYLTPRNYDPRDMPEFLARREALLEPYRLRAFKILAENRSIEGHAGREETLRAFLALTPDDEVLRGLIGEARLDGEWVLSETARALERRELISRAAQAAVQSGPMPSEGRASHSERDTGLNWSAVRRTPQVRVLGTTGRSEIDQTALITDAVGEYFLEVFGEQQDFRAGYTIYLLNDVGERERLFSGMDWLSDADLKLLRRAGGGWLGRGNLLAEWEVNPRRRLDGAARQTLGTLLMDAYAVDGSHGWAWEGVGLYLIYHLVGTRMTYFIDRTDYARRNQVSLWPLLQGQGANWLLEARTLLRSEQAPRLEFLLGRSVDTMRDEDVLVSYALAAFLLEGRPGDLPVILRRTGAGEHPIQVFEGVFGLPLPRIQQRFTRWLDEVLTARGTVVNQD